MKGNIKRDNIRQSQLSTLRELKRKEKNIGPLISTIQGQEYGRIKFGKSAIGL